LEKALPQSAWPTRVVTHAFSTSRTRPPKRAGKHIAESNHSRGTRPRETTNPTSRLSTLRKQPTSYAHAAMSTAETCRRPCTSSIDRTRSHHSPTARYTDTDTPTHTATIDLTHRHLNGILLTVRDQVGKLAFARCESPPPMQLFHYYFQKERDSTTEARNPGRIATLPLHRRPQQFNIDTLTPRVRTADMLDLSPRAP
jgi:hypothetical protein